MKKSGAFKHFQKDNKGSAILSVVLSMIFVVALGTALLYAAYVGMKVSAVSRSDKENFYDASAAMDEILDGIRGEVSIALESAYTQTVSEYARYPESDPQELVQRFFITELGEVKKEDGTTKTGTFSVKTDATSRVTGISLDIDKLKDNYIGSDASAVTLAIGNKEEGKIDVFNFDDASQWPVLIEDISLSYIDGDGFESNISTDIVIEMPEFTSLAIPQNTFALIAKGGFEHAGSLTMTGGLYVGEVGLVVKNNKPLTVKDGKVITEGTLIVEDSAVLNIINNTSEVQDIWAPKIVLGENSILTIGGNIATNADINKNIKGYIEAGAYKIYAGSVELGDGASLIINNPGNEIWFREIVAGEGSAIYINGNCYVADDLVLKSGSKVTLEGSYYGFGSDDAGTENLDTSKSSSIYVDTYEPNNNKASLDISGLESLSLAGVSFINVFGEKIATGQSLAIKPDQLAYLVPAAAITNYKTNPAVLVQEEGNYIAPEINSKTVLWGNKTLADYIGAGDGSVLYRYPQGEGIGYVFINFKNQTKANEYFRDYFSAKPDSIKQYLDIYLDLQHSSSTNTKGNTYQYGEDWENIIGSRSFSDPEAEYYTERYYEMMEKPPEQPYEIYVDTEALGTLGNSGKEYFPKPGNGATAAVVGNEGHNEGNIQSMKLIVTKGIVNINNSDGDHIKGTIIAGGKITIGGNINSVTHVPLTSADLALERKDKKLSDYINVAGFGGESVPTFSTENLWAPEKLVAYANWQKN